MEIVANCLLLFIRQLLQFWNELQVGKLPSTSFQLLSIILLFILPQDLSTVIFIKNIVEILLQNKIDTIKIKYIILIVILALRSRFLFYIH